MLSVLHADGTERVCPLGHDVVTFGRAEDNVMILDAKGVSRWHGRFFRGADGRWWIEDLGSHNGTLVAGNRVSLHLLRHNEIVTVGELAITFCADRTAADTGPVTLSHTPDANPSTLERAARTTGAMDQRRLTALYEISKRLMDQRGVNGLIDVAGEALTSTLGARVVVFGLTCDPDRESDRLIVRPAEMLGSEITLSRSILRRTIDAQRAILVVDTGTDTDLLAAQSVIHGRICSALCVPMMRGSDVTGFIYVDSRSRSRSYTESDLEFACAVGAMAATAIENARLYEAELVKLRMEAELAGARRVQQAILPSSWPQPAGWEVHGSHTACHEVGGDYCNAIVTDDGRLWLVVADVAGKGAPAALQGCCVYAFIRAMVDGCDSPSQLLEQLNRHLPAGGLDQPLVTCLIAAITLDTGEVRFASAGHPYPSYVDAGGSARYVPVENGLILGLLPDTVYEDTRWSFPATGGTLVLYTDGVSEASDPKGEQYGDHGLLGTLSRCGGGTARGTVEAVLGALEEFRGDRHPTDDQTMLACSRQPAS